MKLKYQIWLCFLCATTAVLAQSPIKMQGVAYDRQGQILRNATLFFQLKIHSDSLNGNVVWTDDFEVQSDDQGIYTIDVTDAKSKEEIRNILQEKQSSYYIEESIRREESAIYETVFFQELFHWKQNSTSVFETSEALTSNPQEGEGVLYSKTEVQPAVEAVRPDESNTKVYELEEAMSEEELLEKKAELVVEEKPEMELPENDFEPSGEGAGGFGNGKAAAGTANNQKGELVSEAVENPTYLSVNKQKSLPEGRVMHQMASIGTTMYLVGGYNGENYSKSCWSFNPRERVWQERAAMHVARTGHQMHAVLASLIVVGGTDQAESYIEVFDPLKNEWTQGSAPVAEAEDFFTAVFQNGLYWIAEGDEKTKQDIHHYNVIAGEWTLKGTSPEAGRLQWFGELHGKLLMVLKKQNNTQVVYQRETTGDWTKLPNLPVPIEAPFLLNIGRDIYCIEADSKGQSEKYLFKLASSVWQQKPAYALARRYASIVSRNGLIVLVGGEGDKQRNMNVIEYYNPETEQWESSSRLLVGSSQQVSCIVNQTIYITGGHSIKSFTSDRVESLQFY